jgi:hypothetical protein
VVCFRDLLLSSEHQFLERPLVNYINSNLKCIHKEIKSRLNSGNACYQSIQRNFCLPVYHMKNKVHGTIILHAVLHECETWSLTFRAYAYAIAGNRRRVTNA